jgi:hypothetical protein
MSFLMAFCSKETQGNRKFTCRSNRCDFFDFVPYLGAACAFKIVPLGLGQPAIEAQTHSQSVPGVWGSAGRDFLSPFLCYK